MNILICTDGTEAAIKSAELVTKFGFPTTSRVTVLGVIEREEDLERLTGSMETIQGILGSFSKIEKKVRHGEPIDEILAEVVETTYELVVVGGGGPQLGLLHTQVGSTTGKLARKLDTHFLVVRNVPQQIEKVLFCAGPDTLSSETMSVGGGWISRTNANIGLLHVVTPSKIGINIKSSDERLPSYDTLIEEFSQQLREAGVEKKIETHVRQGLVVEEVLKELTEGGYQLLVIGAHYLPGQDLWQGTLLDDVTDQLINRSTCSVLII